MRRAWNHALSQARARRRRRRLVVGRPFFLASSSLDPGRHVPSAVYTSTPDRTKRPVPYDSLSQSLVLVEHHGTKNSGSPRARAHTKKAGSIRLPRFGSAPAASNLNSILRPRARPGPGPDSTEGHITVGPGWWVGTLRRLRGLPWQRGGEYPA
jgi:hypothetical protein